MDVRLLITVWVLEQLQTLPRSFRLRFLSLVVQKGQVPSVRLPASLNLPPVTLRAALEPISWAFDFL